MFIIIHLERMVESDYRHSLLAVLANTLYSAQTGFRDERSIFAPHHENSPRLILTSKKSEKPNALEIGLAEEEFDDDDLPKPAPPFPHHITLSYSFQQEQFLAQQFYQSASVEYHKLSYDEHPSKKATFKSEPEYESETFSVQENIVVEAEEVKETMKKIQYSSLWGSISDISFEERRELSYRILFNQVQFNLEQSHALTQNVNYGPLV